MKKWTIILLTVLFIAVGITICTHSNASAQQPTSIPNWVKGIAGYWAEGKISDSDFQQAIQFLVDTGVIKIHNATSVINSLKIETELTNSTVQSGNATTVPQTPSLDTLKDSASKWSTGKISDNEYFSAVQTAINAGIIGPFTGPQDELGITTYQKSIPNTNPKTVTVEIPMKQENETITILMEDSIKFVSVDNSRPWGEWEVIGNMRGAGNYPSNNSHFDIGLISEERRQNAIEENITGQYPGNVKLPQDTYKFTGNSGVTWDCYYSFTNEHIGKPFTINVTEQFENITGSDPSILQTIKEQTYFASNNVSWNEGTGFKMYVDQVNALYKMGFIHNPIK